MKQITDKEAPVVANVLRDRANRLYEMACGNWASPSDEEAAQWCAESRQLYRIADRLNP